jgi:CTLH/CRA C-terminal to LisH motif domain
MLEAHAPDVLHGPNLSTSPTNPTPAPASVPLGRQLSNTVSNPSSVFVYPVSLAPAHVNLNLRIQSFIEAVRTRPLAPPPPPASHLTPHHALSLSPYYSPYYSPASSPSPPATGTSGTTRSQQDQSLVLHLGKELVKIVNSLPDPNDRAIFLTELDGIWALMAYPEPEAKSPANVSKYLQYDRRLALADQINSAILRKLQRL